MSILPPSNQLICPSCRILTFYSNKGLQCHLRYCKPSLKKKSLSSISSISSGKNHSIVVPSTINISPILDRNDSTYNNDSSSNDIDFNSSSVNDTHPLIDNVDTIDKYVLFQEKIGRLLYSEDLKMTLYHVK